MITPGQDAGARFIAGRLRSMLADRAGYGKTAQAIRAADWSGAANVTWLCPSHLAENAAREFAKWSLCDRPTTIIENGSSDVPREGLLICSYELARRPETKSRLAKRHCDFLFCDEAHRLNAPGSENAKAVFGRGGILEAATQSCMISASPAQNDVGEWYGFARYFGVWGQNKNKFLERFAVLKHIKDDPKPKIVGVKNVDELRAMLAPHVIAREKAHDDVRGALTIVETPLKPTMPAPTLELDLDETVELAAAVYGRRWDLMDRPSSSTVRRLVGWTKIAGTVDAVLAAPGRSLVFGQHTSTIEGVAAGLEAAGRRVGIIDGRTSKRTRQTYVDAFQDGTGPDVLVCHGRSAGEGLTLTAATSVFLAEPSWNPEDNTQMIARAWRRGQTQDVTAHYLTAPLSIDEAVLAVLRRKSANLQKIGMTQYDPTFIVSEQ